MGSIVAELAEKLTSATNSFDIDEQTLYVNTSADTVGIGTNSPDGKLSVHQSGTGDIFNLYDGTTNILTVVDGGALTHNGTFTIGVDDTGYDVKFFGATATNGYMLWDQSADSLVLGSSSKLGIGITAPTEKLEVAGNIKIADGGTIGSATTAGAITIAQDGVVTLVDDLVIKDGGTIGSATTAAAITIAANGTLTLSTAPAGFNYVATVAAAQTGSTDGIVISGSGTAAAGVTVAHADTSSQADVNNSGNSFIQDITLDTYGHITGITSATATDTNTTYSVATSSALGLVQIGYTENAKNYPVELSSNKMYVNVPWTDTNTTYSAGTGLSLSGTTFSVNDFSDIMFKEQSGTDTSAVRQHNIHIDAHSSGPGIRGPAGLYIEADTSAGSPQSGQNWYDYGGVEIATNTTNGFSTANPYLRIRGDGVYGIEFMGTNQWVDVNIFHETGSGVYNQNVSSTSNIYNAFQLSRSSGTAAGNMTTACHLKVQRSDLDLGAAAGYMQSTHNNYFNRGYIKTLYYNAQSATSDRNVKKNINPISLGLDFVKSLNPVQFNFKDEGEGDNPLSYGFIAQDIEEKINDGLSWRGWDKGNTPNPNENWKEDEEPETLEGTQTIDMIQFIAPLTKAVQELSAQVEALKTRVSELEGV